MANLGVRVALCLLLLAVFADFGLGFSNLDDSLDDETGTIQVLNDADYDITIRNTILYVDGSVTTDIMYTTIPKKTSFNFRVIGIIDSVSTLFTMQTNAALPLHQYLVDWSNLPGTMKVPCLPHCYWVVDDNGFSVAPSDVAALQFVTGWD